MQVLITDRAARVIHDTAQSDPDSMEAAIRPYIMHAAHAIREQVLRDSLLARAVGMPHADAYFACLLAGSHLRTYEHPLTAQQLDEISFSASGMN